MPRNKKRLVTGITLVGMHPSGNAFCYLGDRKLYVREAIPGEEADVRLLSRQRNWLQAEVAQLITASPHRVKVRCVHHAICGGCQWQHVDYPMQLHLKKTFIEAHFRDHLLSIPQEITVRPSPEQLGYRNRLEFSFSARRWYLEGEGKVLEPSKRLAVGFHPADDAGKVFQISECPLMPGKAVEMAQFVLNEAIKANISLFDPKTDEGILSGLVIRTNSQDQSILIFNLLHEPDETCIRMMKSIHTHFEGILGVYFRKVVTKEEKIAPLVQVGGNEPVLFEESYDGLRLQIGADAFCQPNTRQATQIYQRIASIIQQIQPARIIELYAGIGAIAMHVAPYCQHLVAIEDHAEAVANARLNAKNLGFAHLHFVQGDVLETFTNDWFQQQGGAEVIILDPPRSGTLKTTLRHLILSQVRYIIYLSCNPNSLTRDLKMLDGAYEISLVEAFDLFPQTTQVEILVMLKLRS